MGNVINFTGNFIRVAFTSLRQLHYVKFDANATQNLKNKYLIMPHYTVYSSSNFICANIHIYIHKYNLHYHK